MSTLTWGSGGSQRSTFTSGVGDGWYTNNLALPDVRAIYDGSRPIRVASVTATAGSGNRTFAYAIGSSGWRLNGYHLISTSSVFSFRVTNNAGTSYLALLLGQSGKNTYWVDGSLAPSGGSAVQPGSMTYYEAPSAPTINSVTPSLSVPGSVAIDISGPSSNGGQSVNGYWYQVSTNSGFTAVIKEFEASGDTTITGLPTGTTLYVRVMARNSVTDGVSKKGGAASSTKSFSLGTAPVTAPGIAVTASPAGTGATITLTPPSSTGGLPIDNYEFSREYLAPPPIPSPATVTTATTALTNNVSGLQPGAQYRWRARAHNAIGWGPWSSYVTVTQPAPSTSPGQFFDGNTTDTPETTFGWSGTTNNSASYADTFVPEGWLTTHTTELSLATMSRVVGGLFGTYAAQMGMLGDNMGPGQIAGIGGPTWSPYASDVVEGVTYWASMYVNPSRTQRLAMRVSWYNAADGFISATVGTGQEVGSGVWTRLTMSAMAPANAVKAGIFVIDVEGTGWLPWLGGDTMLLDGAMLSIGELYPYFDGSFPDTDTYDYDWQGTAHRSTSSRTPNDSAPDDPLDDPDCVSPPAPPRPPTVPADCIDAIGQWRRYWSTIPATEVSDWLTVLPTIEIQTRAQAARQVRIRVYPNPFGYAPEEVNTDEWCSEQIISYIPPNTIFTLDGVTQRSWAEVDGGSSLNADHLVYGTNGVPPTWPHLSCGISYLVSYDIDAAAEPQNFSTRIFLTERT